MDRGAAIRRTSASDPGVEFLKGEVVELLDAVEYGVEFPPNGNQMRDDVGLTVGSRNPAPVNDYRECQTAFCLAPRKSECSRKVAPAPDCLRQMQGDFPV